MGTLVEKLQKTLAGKEKIRKAIESKGVYVGNTPFSEYGNKIGEIANDAFLEPDWIDISDVLANDTQEYRHKSVYLLSDYDDTIILAGGDAYKTSDSDALIVDGGEYTFTGAGDVVCSLGYKTRYLIVYSDIANNERPSNIESLALWVILDGKTDISSFFLDFFNLRSVYLPEGLGTIGYKAFEGCSSLRSVNLNSITNGIRKRAFYNCASLRNIDIPNNVDGSIDHEAFYNCNFEKAHIVTKSFPVSYTVSGSSSSFRSFPFLGVNVKELRVTCYTDCMLNVNDSNIDKIIFENCHPTFGIRYHRNLIEISKVSEDVYAKTREVEFINSRSTTIYSFLYDGSILKDIVIQPGVVTLSDISLLNAPFLKTVSLPDTVRTIGMYNFYNCPYLETVNIPLLVTTINDYCFCKCHSLKTFTIPSNITSIKTNCFSFCDSLVSVILGDNVSSIESTCFYNCKSLKSITLPQGLINLCDNFMSVCDSITEYTVPERIKNIGSNSFSRMATLKRFAFEDGYDGHATTSCLFYNSAADCPELEYVYLPASISMDDSANNSSVYHIGYNCPKLTVVELGQGYKQGLNLGCCTKLTHDAIVAALNALTDLTGVTSKKLILGSVNLAKLTDEEKAIATNKNWTLS